MHEAMTSPVRPLPDFGAFFQALWGHDPFPWQIMLAERVATGKWPRVLDLPTASGKTACIDIAVYALAVQADRPLQDRTAPRRIWFVVDRRIVVDEAFERAHRIAMTLAEAARGPLHEIAQRLRRLSGTDRPLAVGRLRGAIFRDDGWARLPSQPAVITSTVDQLGSRLLFRAYGHSRLAAPIFAGLAANDSLIVLDEAHCAVPFMQTLEAVARYRGPDWAEEPLSTPFAFVVMSATPPQGISGEAVFPGAERTRALDHPELQRRFRTPKPAQLVRVNRASGNEEDPLVAGAIARAAKWLRDGRRRVAVMVNRVRTARSIADGLRTAAGEDADVVLLTGRIRPFERDGLVDHWSRYLKAGRPQDPSRPIVVVATQCLEVGADFNFDALVTECASLDALRQRFGRLARLGSELPPPAVILIREDDVDPGEPDPIYGHAIRETWRWLREQAAPDADGVALADMGVAALESRLPPIEEQRPLLAPTAVAPVLFPAHVDLLCQTSPPPYPEPDVWRYLHGQPGPPEVSVVWRCDLTPEHRGIWAETVALCPPVSGEMLRVPLWRARAWLADRPTADESADVESLEPQGEDVAGRIRPCLLWRGRERSKVARHATEVAPEDVVVVPVEYGIANLGLATGVQGLGSGALDVWEPARHAAGVAPAVRILRSVLAPWLGWAVVEALIKRAEAPDWSREEIREAIDAVLAHCPADEEASVGPPDWWLELLRQVRGHLRCESHPAGGVVVFGPAPAASRAAAESDLFVDDDDLASAAEEDVGLEQHTESVRRAAVRLTERCLPAPFRAPIECAAMWHDAGKLDERFQILLRGGDEVAVVAAAAPLAKSSTVLLSPLRRRRAREASGLPEHFRHEMLSMQLAERFAELPPGADDLVLHLVASHHGHGRPFAPVSLDPAPPDVSGRVAGIAVEFGMMQRVTATAAHAVASGLVERFWRLTRRYGWWGLAYLEAIFRLADWYGSAFVMPVTEVEERSA